MHIILYDGVCGLCNRLVRFVLRRDRRGAFRFASLQSAFAAKTLEDLGQDPLDLDTLWVLADHGTSSQALLSRSRAVLFVLGEIGWPWRVATALGVLPAGVLDLAYGVVARFRYRIFGRYDSCPVPEAGDRDRFVETETEMGTLSVSGGSSRPCSETESVPASVRVPVWVAVVAAGVVTAGLFAFWIWGPRSLDFVSFYGAGTAVLEGRTESLYDRHYLMELQQRWKSPDRAGGFYPYYYPPVFALAYVPLALLPMVPARVAWGAASLLLVAGAVGLSRRWSGLGRSESVLLLLLVGPLYIALVQLHMSPLLLLVFALEALALWGGRGGFGAGLLAGVALMKPQLLLPLGALWLWRSRWRELSGLLLACAAVAGGSLLLSVPASQAWVETRRVSMGAGLRSLEGEAVNLTLYSGLNAFLSDRASLVAAGLLALAVVAGLLAVWGRREPGGPYHHALLWLAPVLVTPYLGAYDLLLAYLPLTFLAGRLRGDRALAWVVLVVLALQLSMLPVKAAHVKLVPWSLLALYGLCWWRAFRRVGSTGR